MSRNLRICLAVCLAVAVPACKIVPNKSADDTAIAADASGDDARNRLRLEESFEAQLLPRIRETALPLSDLHTAIAAGLDAAGEAHGNRGSGQGAAWNFSVSGSGVVVAAKLDTRARWVDLDIDADGAADLKIQLGPVIRGTAIRDVAPFYKFDDFRDQIEFAKLSRALNDAIKPLIIVPEGDLLGMTVSFIGVTPLKSATEEIVVTPIQIAFAP